MGKAENGKDKRSKGLILKTLERCRSLGSHRKGDQKRQRTPEGCFSVYVGPARERFVVRTECANHPLFKMLLDEAEMEFGYSAAGPLELPCNVDLFQKVLWEVEQDAAEMYSSRCNFSKAHAGYLLLSPARAMITGRV